MSSSKLIRWSGLAAFVGGVLVLVIEAITFVIIGGQPQSVAATTSVWVILEVSLIAAFVLILLGLVGLYARQAQQAGTLGMIAFLVAFIGTVMLAGSEWSAAFLAPWLAETAPSGLLEAEPSGVLAAGYILSLLLFVLGYVLFGLASLRAGVLPRGAAVLLMVGAVLFIVLAMLDIPFWTFLLGPALAWMGYALWASTDEPALSAQAAT